MALQIKTFLIFIIFGYLSFVSYGQEDSVFHSIRGDTLFVTAVDGVLLELRVFSHPEYLYYDLDSDEQDELIIIDKSTSDTTGWYIVFVFEISEGFFLADSLTSGLAEPVIEFSDEVNSLIIITGDPDFDSVFPNSESEVFYPAQFWVYTGVEFLNVNTDIYNLFLKINEELEKILVEIEGYEDDGCGFTQVNKRLIASIYINYRHAFEDVLAEQFLLKFYNCPDMAEFRNLIEQLL